MKYKLLLTLISVALFSQSILAAKGGNKPVPQQQIPEPGQAVIVDANGTMIGDVQTNVGGSDGSKVYFEVNEKFYVTSFYNGDIEGYLIESNGGWFYHDLPGCAGNGYTESSSYASLGYESTIGPKNGMFYISDGDSQTVEVLSVWSESGFTCDYFDNITCDEPYPYRFNCVNVLDVQPEPLVLDDLFLAVPVIGIDMNIYTKPYRLKLTPPN